MKLIIKAGFDPNEIVKFLYNIKDISSLQNRIFSSENSQNSFFYSHIPHLQIKFQQLFKNPRKNFIQPNNWKGNFLKKIDGLLFGKRPSEGFFFKK